MREDIDVVAWEEALLADLAHEAALMPKEQLGSIFFGGGTPSLMPPSLAGKLIDAATRHWAPSDNIEITLEANPSSVEAARFADLATAGVNRISLGLQSLDNEALKFLGRAHNVDEGLAALTTAQENFARVSFDLIYALPKQTPEQWQTHLERALSFGTSHMSLYQLTIEEGTRFASDVRKGVFTPANNDRGADLYSLTQQIMGDAHMPAYEISNHARVGEESRHNLTYWRYADYVGIGPGAHGRRLNHATQRHKKPENFLSASARNGHGIQSEDNLDTGTQIAEALLMGLRLREGLDLSALSSRFSMPIDQMIDRAKTEQLAGYGLIRLDEDWLGVTPKGMPLLDAILPEIVI